MLHSIWVLGSPTGDETCTPYAGSIVLTREALCSLHCEALQVLLGSYLKALFLNVSFGLILKSDCPKWIWLTFGPFPWEQGLFHWNCAGSTWPNSFVLGAILLELC